MKRPRKKGWYALETKFLDDGRVEFKYLGEVDKDAIGNIDYSFHEKNDEYIFTDYFGSRAIMELYQAAILKNSLKEIQENKKRSEAKMQRSTTSKKKKTMYDKYTTKKGQSK